MRVGDFHLTYCSNIHAAETWPEVQQALAEALPRVRELLAYDGAMGVGLRLSADAAAALDATDTFARFQAFLRHGRYYVLTINGFPYGTFHGQRVKERVYLPDWREPARLDYTNRLARLLAALLSDEPEIEGSVSTVPGAFREHITSADDVAAMASGILKHAACLTALKEDTGIAVTLAIEPEPACYLETVADVLAFFGSYLFDAAHVASAARATGRSLTVDDVRQHVGVCFDACHMAVEFEDPVIALQRLEAAGIRVCKVQLSSALRFEPRAGSSPQAAFGPLAEHEYLHQVVQRGEGGLVRYNDLPDALADPDPRAAGREWRVHYHVPIFLPEMAGLDTTQGDLRRLLVQLKEHVACPYLEVETYTWSVLPPEHRGADMCEAIARELAWVRAALEP